MNSAEYPPRLVVLVDDEIAFLEDLAILVEALSYRCETFTSIEAARRGLKGRVDPFVVLLDHDFRAEAGEEEEGYALAEWLRKNHPLREVLPIVYLTGRESPEDFVRRHQELRLFAPDSYLNKSQLAAEPERLPDLLAYYDEELARYEAMVEEHGETTARYFFYEIYYG